MSGPGDPVGVAAFAASRLASDLRLQFILWSLDKGGQAMSVDARARARVIWPQLRASLDQLRELAPNAAAKGAERLAQLQEIRARRAGPGWRPGCAVAQAVIAADAVAEQLLEAADPYRDRAARVEALVAAFVSWSWLCRTSAEAGRQATDQAAIAA